MVKQKKTVQRNPKPKETVLEKSYIAQLENEVDRLRSTVELFIKTGTLHPTGQTTQQDIPHPQTRNFSNQAQHSDTRSMV